MNQTIKKAIIICVCVAIALTALVFGGIFIFRITHFQNIDFDDETFYLKQG